MNPRLRALASSGWLPAAILAVVTVFVLNAYGTPVLEAVVFGVYVSFGIAVPGMLWVRLLRGRGGHIAEDLALGLVFGYCLEIATYVVARAIGAPLLFLLWPISTLFAFSAVPVLRRHWRGDGSPAPVWWSWSLAGILGYLVIFSAGTFFAVHHISGSDTPYVDMPYQLALIGELRNHMPPQIPYAPGLPLAYHWFFYAEAAATSWATGIEPVTLLYRLSALPMFVAIVVLTAVAARRLTGRLWTGPVAVAVALFGTVAWPYRWVSAPVFDSQTLGATWLSPTNLLGLTLLSAIVLTLFDLLQGDAKVPRSHWLILILFFVGASGAKASVLPLVIFGMMVVVVGVAVSRRRLHLSAAAGLALAVAALLLAVLFIYRGGTDSMGFGPPALSDIPLVALTGGQDPGSVSRHVVQVVGLLVAVVLWCFLWAGAFILLLRRGALLTDLRILLLLGLCAAALGAVSVLSYPGLSQMYYVRGAAEAFGLVATAGIAAAVPARARYLPLIACVAVAAVVGGVSAEAVRLVGPEKAPTLASAHLSGVLPAIVLPVLALLGVACAAYVALRSVAPRLPVLQGAVPLLVIAVVMGFSLPSAARVLASPLEGHQRSDLTVPGDGIQAARWLRDHSDSSDLVATNLHSTCYPRLDNICDARHFWVSAYAERHVLVEGWAYTPKVKAYTDPFWDQPLLEANDAAFTDPSAAAEATLRDTYHVRWLFADVTMANADSIAQYADLRHREGNFAVYELRRP